MADRGVRSSWLAFATKSARVRSAAWVAVRSTSWTIRRPSEPGAVRASHHTPAPPSPVSSSARGWCPSAAVRRNSSRLGWRNATRTSPPTRCAPKRSTAARLACRMRSPFRTSTGSAMASASRTSDRASAAGGGAGAGNGSRSGAGASTVRGCPAGKAKTASVASAKTSVSHPTPPTTAPASRPASRIRAGATRARIMPRPYRGFGGGTMTDRTGWHPALTLIRRA